MAEPALLAGILAGILTAAPPAGAHVSADMSPRTSAPDLPDMSQRTSTTPPPDASPSDPASPTPQPGAPGPDQRPLAADHPAAVSDPEAPPPPLPDPSPATAVEGPAPAPAPAATHAAAAGPCHGSRPCKRLLVLGSLSGALGVATVIAGAVLAARPIVIDPDDPTMAITYRPAGTAVLTIGIGVLATSLLTTLAAVRASRQARRAAMARSRSSALAL